MTQGIDRLKLDHAMDVICELGCQTVREVVHKIESGKVPEPAKSLNADECECLLTELKSLMKTYKQVR